MFIFGGMIRSGNWGYVFPLLLWLLAGAALVMGIAALHLWHYEDLVKHILQITERPYLYETLSHHYFTLEKYRLLRKLSLCILSLYLLASAALYKYRFIILYGINSIRQDIAYTWHFYGHFFRRLPRWEKYFFYAVMLLLLLRGMYMIQSRAIQYDEAWTYNYFIAQPFYLSFFIYNNHPFYILLAGLVKGLPFTAIVNYRLPVLAGGLLLAPVFFLFLRQRCEALAAWMGWIFFVFGAVFSSFSLYGRGYIWMLFFLTISFFSLLSWSFGTGSSRRLYYGAFFNALAFYSGPSYLLAFIPGLAATLIYAGYARRSGWKEIAGSLLVTLGITFLLYLPMMLGTGMGSGIKVAIEAGSDPSFWAIWPRRTLWYSHFITNFREVGILLYLIITGLIWSIFSFHRSEKYRFLPLFLGIHLLFPLLFIILRQNYFVERVWCHQALILAISISYVVSIVPAALILPKANGPLLVIGLSLAGILLLGYRSYHQPYLRWNEEQDLSAKHIAQALQAHGLTKCYSGYTYFDPMLEYYFRIKEQAIVLHSSDQGSVRYLPPENIPLFPAYISLHSSPLPVLPGYEKKYEDNWASLWVKMDVQP